MNDLRTSGVRRVLLTAGVVCLAVGLSGCTDSPNSGSAPSATVPSSSGAGSAGSSVPVPATDSPAGSVADVVRVYGSVPIPTPPTVQPTATASPEHPTILEMGAPVRASLPGAVRAVVTALGPVELTPAPGTPSTPGIITVDVVAERGSLTVGAGDFSSRDETGKVVALQARSSRAVTATPGHPARIVVRGTYDSGAAQMTWRHDGRVVAVWDFNIELD